MKRKYFKIYSIHHDTEWCRMSDFVYTKKDVLKRCQSLNSTNKADHIPIEVLPDQFDHKWLWSKDLNLFTVINMLKERYPECQI